jgi:hypothetical protein
MDSSIWKKNHKRVTVALHVFFKLSEKNISMKEFLLNSEKNPICFIVSKKNIDLRITDLVPSSDKSMYFHISCTVL